MSRTIQYQTTGTCCKLMQVTIGDDDRIIDVDFIGGCPGNLLGIRSLVKGMKIDEVIEKFAGIRCGNKSSSCPDQLAHCLMELKEKAAK